jgi:chromosome segregation ATPase
MVLEEIDRISKEAEETRAKKENLEKYAGSLKNKLNEQQNQLSKEENETRQALQNIAIQLKTNEAFLVQIKETQKLLKENNEKISKNIDSYENELKNKKTQERELKKQNDNLKNKIAEFEEQKKLLDKELDKKAKLEKEITALQSKNKQIIDDLQLLKNGCMQEEKKYKENLEKIKVMESVYDDIKKTKEEVKKKQEEKTGLSDNQVKLASEIERLRKEVAEAKLKNEFLEKRLAALSTENVPAAPIEEKKSLTDREKEILNSAEEEKSAPKVEQPAMERKNKITKEDEYFQLAIQKYDDGNYEEALEAFKTVVKLNSNAAGAWYNIALIYSKQGKDKEACSTAYRAAQEYLKAGNMVQASRMLAFIRSVNPMAPEAEKLHKEIIKHSTAR